MIGASATGQVAGGAPAGVQLSIGEIGARPPLVTADAERSIEKGLAYLGRTQARDGTWVTRGGYGGGYPTAMTALAGLALMAGGNSPIEGEYAAHVRLAVDAIVERSNANGLIADMATERGAMQGHGFAMLFLAEAYGMEQDESRQARIRDVLERAILLTGRSQSKAGGWLYTPDSGGDEGSVTVTQIQGLRAARNAGVTVPKTIIDRACEYIEKSANPDGGIRHRAGTGGASRPAITAAAVATMYNAGEYEHPVAKKAFNYVQKQLAQTRTGFLPERGHQFYALFYTAQAMYMTGEAEWRDYFPQVRDELIRLQKDSGAWDGDSVGEVYGTSIALTVLQLPYAHLPILMR
jgi:hypothetical protein